MNPSLVLLSTYLVVTVALQFVGFVVSRIMDMIDPTLSLMTFLVLFIGMFWLAWPVAVRIAALLVPETESERAAARAIS